MPIVKHNNRNVENNPRMILDEELSRYVEDGWYISHDEVMPLPVQKPADVLTVTETVKAEEVIVLPVVNVEPVKTESVSTKKEDQYFQKQRGRPRKF